MDDLKKIHTLDSQDLLGCTLKVPKSLVNELARQVGESNQDKIQEITEKVRPEFGSWAPEVPSQKNLAKKLAQECMGCTVVVYAGSKMGHAAYLWRRAMNRVAKIPAWQVNFTQDAEDDLFAWSVDNGVRPHTIIQLRSDLETEKIEKLFSATNRLLSGKRPHVHSVKAKGDSQLEQLIWASVLGQCVAIYVSIASGYDPADDGISNKLQKILDKK